MNEPETPGAPLDEFGDKIAALDALRSDDEEASARVLDELGDPGGPVDRLIRQEMAVRPALAVPDDLESAHQSVVHGIEVLYRNGHVAGSLEGFGFLAPVARLLQQVATRFVVRRHIENVVQTLTMLYVARESQMAWGDPAMPALRRARLQMERLETRVERGRIGVPGFLVGGVALSTGATMLGSAVSRVTGDDVVLGTATLVVLVVTLILGWTLLRSVGIAHRRIELTIAGPLEQLYTAVGLAGEPPVDHSRMLALGAFLVMTVIWLIIPAAILAAYLN